MFVNYVRIKIIFMVIISRFSVGFLGNKLLKNYHPLLFSTLSTFDSFNWLDDTRSVLNDSFRQLEVNLETMKLAELQQLLRKLGGVPGSKRKADLYELCKFMLMDRWRNKNENSTVTDSKILESFNLKLFGAEDSSLLASNTNNDNPVPPPTVTKKQWVKLPARTVQEGAQSGPSKEENSVSKEELPKEEEPKNRQWPRPKLRSLPPMPEVLDEDVELEPYDGPEDSLPDKQIAVRKKFEFPVGEARDERLSSIPSADMELTFLGTASCVPTLSRGVSCVALRYSSDLWLFDCGESSQIQLQKSRLSVSKVRRIFLTHMHGDHAFGLPGVLCMMGQATQESREKDASDGVDVVPLDIYGPEGTRDLVRSVMQLSYSRVAAPYRIHELKNVPFLHNKFVRRKPEIPLVRTRFDPLYGEHEGGTDIYPDENGCYHLLDDAEFSVHAAPMQHTIPCVGYVVREKEKPGRLKVELVQEVVLRNREALKSQLNLKDGLKAFGMLKQMQPGQTFTFPDGTVVRADDIVEPPRPGRKVVVMGDTCNGDAIASLAMDADLIVHEATNAWLRELDAFKFPTYQHLERHTVIHGHSTPQMAGRFAKKIRAKRLILTHFSPRYRGDDNEFFMRQMWRIEQNARDAAGMSGANDVIAAWDQMNIAVPTPNKG